MTRAVEGDGLTHPEPAPGAGTASAAPALLLQGLLDVAGSAATELLVQLHADLRQARQALAVAVAGAAMDEIRAQSHVLIALAGTVGAEALHRQCKALNALAHQPLPPPAALSTLAAQVLAGLATLIDQIAPMPTLHGGVA